MKSERAVARSLLMQLLPENGEPELGARLKQRIVEVFRSRGLPHPRLGKFSSFLAENSDIVDVARDEIPSDVRVRRKTANKSQVNTEPAVVAPPVERAPRLAPDLWAALTNPDPTRRRFYSRLKNRVVHYRENSGDEADSRIREEVERNERDFVEVSFVIAETQKGWMKEFLRIHPLPGRMRDVFDRLLELPYSSGLNYAFTASLGERAELWRVFRARRVHDVAQEWAAKNAISLSRRDDEADIKGDSHGTAPVELRLSAAASPLRVALHRAIDALNDSDLERVLLPASALVARLD